MSDPHLPDNHSISRNARLGMILFIIYVIFYAGFVALAAFSLDTMKREIAGVNVAIIYGMALIVLAFVLALIYMALASKDRGGEP